MDTHRFLEKNPKTNQFDKVSIGVGVTTLEKVEVLSGLTLGDEIALFPSEVKQ